MMTERTYTVREVEELRRAIDNKYLYGSYKGPSGVGGFSRSYSEPEKSLIVEQQVKTHMLAGHTAEDLFAADAARQRGSVAVNADDGKA